MWLYAIDMALHQLHMDATDNYGKSSYVEAAERVDTILWLLDLRSIADGTFGQPRAVTLGNHLRPNG